ncbi:MAG: IS630 family transposase [Alphaproteobacteria bacterium]|uniref:IS630 family transposase n=1 Tax=Candidatus Nitrobium versatile TaxID=2884831 RepID=A0A953J274_9BACT|nr:IS630 family transposase [Candidatus Nitrobium versatile]
MRPHGTPEELEHRRRRAIELLEEGHPPVEVAKRCGVGRRSVRKWKAQYRKEGEQGIAAKPASGRPPKLTSNDRKHLEEALLSGAKAQGFPTELWTCPRVAVLIARLFGVHYHVDYIGRLLHALGWSPQKPERKAVERNEEAIVEWKRSEWPRIKKKRHD